LFRFGNPLSWLVKELVRTGQNWAASGDGHTPCSSTLENARIDRDCLSVMAALEKCDEKKDEWVRSRAIPSVPKTFGAGGRDTHIWKTARCALPINPNQGFPIGIRV